MSTPAPDDQLTDEDRAALVALVDGSLTGAAATALRERVDAEPELSASLRSQTRARELLAAVREPAPPALRERLATQAARTPRRPTRRRRYLQLGSAVAATAAVVVLVVVLVSGGGSGATKAAPTFAQVAGLAALGPSAPAPSPSPAAPQTLLAADVQGVAFPNWHEQFGWSAAGARDAQTGGRLARTVFYEKGGKLIGYTILAGRQLAWPAGSAATLVNGVTLHTLAGDGRNVVTWRRAGHTCVLSGSGSGVAPAVLLKLASWRGSGTVAF